MDKIQKALKKLSPIEREKIKAILSKLNRGKLEGLEILQLQGHRDIFRVRKGNLRIIFRREGNDIRILAIERRNEATYKNL
jgi:mRNA-degrading endonuclease RelE of RelBE toxin-antitoxin system